MLLITPPSLLLMSFSLSMRVSTYLFETLAKGFGSDVYLTDHTQASGGEIAGLQYGAAGG